MRKYMLLVVLGLVSTFGLGAGSSTAMANSCNITLDQPLYIPNEWNTAYEWRSYAGVSCFTAVGALIRYYPCFFADSPGSGINWCGQTNTDAVGMYGEPNSHFLHGNFGRPSYAGGTQAAHLGCFASGFHNIMYYIVFQVRYRNVVGPPEDWYPWANWNVSAVSPASYGQCMA